MALKYTTFLFKFETLSDLFLINCFSAHLLPSVGPDALTFQSAQGRCPGGGAEQAHHREHHHRRIAVGCHRGFVPLWKVWSSVSGQISAPESRSAAFSCDASRTRFHRGSHSSGEGKKKTKTVLHRPKPVATHLQVISKHYNNSNKNDILIFRCRFKLFFPSSLRRSAHPLRTETVLIHYRKTTRQEAENKNISGYTCGICHSHRVR